MSNPSRVQSGVPTGGQFAAGAHSESDTPLTLPALPLDPPKPIGDLGIPVGDSLMLDDFDTGSDLFSAVEIVHEDEGTYRVDGTINLDLEHGLAPLLPTGLSDDYLNDRNPDIENYLADEYDAELDAGCDDWSCQQLSVSTPLAATDLDSSILDRLASDTSARRLQREINGSPNVPAPGGDFFDRMRSHLYRQDQDRRKAMDAYTVAALWTGTYSPGTAEDGEPEPMDSAFDASDIDPASLEGEKATLVDFMRANRGDLALAMQRPGYDASQVGHDFLLTRNHHGAGFWDRGLGDVGDRLTAAAQIYGSSDLYVGDGGDLHFGG